MSSELLTQSELTERHGDHVLKDCIWAVVRKYDDGFIECPLVDAEDWGCHKCWELFNEMKERKRRKRNGSNI